MGEFAEWAFGKFLQFKGKLFLHSLRDLELVVNDILILLTITAQAIKLIGIKVMGIHLRGIMSEVAISCQIRPLDLSTIETDLAKTEPNSSN